MDFGAKKERRSSSAPPFTHFITAFSADTNCQVEHTPNDYEKKRAISCNTILLAVQKYNFFEYDSQRRLKFIF